MIKEIRIGSVAAVMLTSVAPERTRRQRLRALSEGMKSAFRFPTIAIALMVGLALGNTHCTLPSNLTYSTNPAVYTQGTSIEPNVPSNNGGAVIFYSAAPALPAGLNLDRYTGIISGIPTAATPTANYTVTGSNFTGSTTVNLNITVTAASRLAVFAGLPGGPGNVDGTGAAARFYSPIGVAVDGSGNVYVADVGNYTIRKVTPTGVVSTLAGKAGEMGSTNGTGADARFHEPTGVAVDGSGNVYVADSYNGTIQKITPGGVVSTLAGTAGQWGSADGTGADAQFSFPDGVAVDGSGNVYVADTDNHTIRKITPDGKVSTLAGTAGQWGSADGTGADARFFLPGGIAVDGSGNVYVADFGNNTIRKVTPAGKVSTIAGTAGQSGSADGTGTDARFHEPTGVAVDGFGNVYVADKENSTIRKVTSAGVVSTLAGKADQSGSVDGTGVAARFSVPYGIAVDGSGNVYVADPDNNNIRKVTSGGVVSTLAGTTGQYGSADGTGAEARFFLPDGVAVDGSGNVYVADTNNDAIRKITPAGVVSTFAGKAGEIGSVDGTGAEARFYSPHGIAVDGSGNVYVADTKNDTIRKITPAGVVSTFAGMAGYGGSGDGTGAEARFYSPHGVAVDGSGNVYVADTGNSTIRKITPLGVVSTLAGTAGEMDSTNGTGAAARFFFPRGIAVNGSGNVYVTEISTIRKITPDGVVSAFAGTSGQGGSTDGTGAAAQFSNLFGAAVDGSGNVYVADTDNSTIRKITPLGVVSTVVGVPGSNGTIPGSLPASINYPIGVAVDSTTGSLFIVADNAVLKVYW